MDNRKMFLLSTAICLLVSGCVGPGVTMADPIVPTKTEQVESTATNIIPENTNTPTIPVFPAETETPTLVPTSTKTPFPTINKHRPTPTVERPVEWDIDPYIEYEIEGEYKGVKIKASVIIDRSLEPLVEGIYVNNNLLSEMIAKSLAYVWYSRRGNYYAYQYERFTSDEMDKWFGVWAKAQETGSEYYWRQIQLDNVWANDLNDGDGYVQQSYIFWPMYEGPTPYGVTAIDKITIVLFDVPKSDIRNVTPIHRWAVIGAVNASNLDNNNLIFYSGRDMSMASQRRVDITLYPQKLAIQIDLQVGLSHLTEYLIWNDGNTDFTSADIVFGVSDEMWRIIERAVEYKLKIE